MFIYLSNIRLIVSQWLDFKTFKIILVLLFMFMRVSRRIYASVHVYAPRCVFYPSCVCTCVYTASNTSKCSKMCTYLFFPGEVYVHRALDYEQMKYLTFDVTATTLLNQSIHTLIGITKTKVKISILDVDDNCPVFTSPSYFEISVSSPVVADALLYYVKASDNDSFSNYSYSIDNQNFQIAKDGMIRSSRTLVSLVDEFYNVTVWVSDGKCSDVCYVGVRLRSCGNPSKYMFTSNGIYVETVAENKNVGSSILTVDIVGNLSRKFSIIGSSAKTQFEIDSNSGKHSLSFN